MSVDAAAESGMRPAWGECSFCGTIARCAQLSRPTMALYGMVRICDDCAVGALGALGKV